MRVAIYARVSKDDDPKTPRKTPATKTGTKVKIQNPENQLRELRIFAKTQNWEIVHEYVDRASGKTADRPQFKKLFEDASQRRFDVVLFWALDRLSREGIVQTLTYLQSLSRWGVAYRSLKEHTIDTTGPWGELLIAILATFAKQERLRISERTIEGLKRARAAGKTLGRPIVPVDLPRIRRLQAEGKSLRAIAREVDISLSTIMRSLKEVA